MSKYKICKGKNSFSVWKLKNVGNGCHYDDTGRHFRTVEEAKQFVVDDRRKDKEEKMIAVEKAKETRRRSKEAQRAKVRERIEIREKLKVACLHVLDDPSASSADKIKAVEFLCELTKGR